MEIKNIIAKNLVDLRKSSKLTQAELAKKINYSDKTISKWEHGEAIPDIEILMEICKLYNITLNDIVKEDAMNCLDDRNFDVKKNNANKIIITSLATLVVWLIATFVNAYFQILVKVNYWTIFIWAIPVSCIVLLVFNGIWGKRMLTFIIISVLIWSVLAGFYLEFLEHNIWPIFLTGAPAQIAIILWSGLKKSEKNVADNIE